MSTTYLDQSVGAARDQLPPRLDPTGQHELPVFSVGHDLFPRQSVVEQLNAPVPEGRRHDRIHRVVGRRQRQGRHERLGGGGNVGQARLAVTVPDPDTSGRLLTIMTKNIKNYDK